MDFADMLVELRLQGPLTLGEFRTVPAEMSFECRGRTSRTLRFEGNGSQPAGDAKEWALHMRTLIQDTRIVRPVRRLAVRRMISAPGAMQPEYSLVRANENDLVFFQFFRAFPQEVPIIHSFCTKRRGFSVAVKRVIKHSACRHSEMFLRVLPGIAAEPAVPEDSRG